MMQVEKAECEFGLLYFRAQSALRPSVSISDEPFIGLRRICWSCSPASRFPAGCRMATRRWTGCCSQTIGSLPCRGIAGCCSSRPAFHPDRCFPVKYFPVGCCRTSWFLAGWFPPDRRFDLEPPKPPSSAGQLDRSAESLLTVGIFSMPVGSSAPFFHRSDPDCIPGLLIFAEPVAHRSSSRRCSAFRCSPCRSFADHCSVGCSPAGCWSYWTAVRRPRRIKTLLRPNRLRLL